MTDKEALRWFEDLARRGRGMPEALVLPPNLSYYFAPTDAAAWLAEALAALQAVFPPRHALLTNWSAIIERAKTHVVTIGVAPNTVALRLVEPHAKVNFLQAVGVIDGAVTLVKGGHLSTLADGVRAETVSEVLDQAQALLPDYTVAATVLAGGALETHLLHLCIKSDLTWPGDGSIGKYDQAIAQARNEGTVVIYGATDSKLIGAWGGMRNDAAHDPTKFKRPADEVRFMIEQVRSFIVRVP